MTPVVQVTDLVKHYPAAGRAAAVRAVDGVSFELAAGETLGLVGESGSGKSTVGRAVLRLEAPTSGRVAFDGTDLASLQPRELRALRRRMQIVAQDARGALNPRRTIGASITEALIIHGIVPRGEMPLRVTELLHEVGLHGELASRFPHECSGGQQQRVGIARALAVEPTLIVCDEPVTALDVSVQAQVLNLLVALRERHGLTYLFIAHDLAVVRQVAHRVAVMYLGAIIEIGPTRSVIGQPRHPYTQALVSAVPPPEPGQGRARIVLDGEPPSPSTRSPGCPFAPRCFHPSRDTRCATERPALRLLGDQEVACHHATC